MSLPPGAKWNLNFELVLKPIISTEKGKTIHLLFYKLLHLLNTEDTCGTLLLLASPFPSILMAPIT